MGTEDEEIKVIDRRFSSKDAKNETKESEGEGFVMKESGEPASSSHVREVDFSTFVFSLATGALINLGLSPDPITKKTQKDVNLAKQDIDILAMLMEKTRGNLNNEEAELLTSLLTEVRLRYVEATKSKS
ncbi:MAG: DUF1844 domain-containing protein [Bdellovibrionales bacterium]|nr:DUF1844 domain-containing protein [Bdellovibrionales bacterium]